MDAAQRSLRSRLGGYRTAALYDAREINAKARSTYRESFRAGHACRLCPPFVMPAGLPEPEIRRRADALRSAHFTRLSIASAASRAKKKRKTAAAVGTPATASEVRRAAGEPQTAA